MVNWVLVLSAIFVTATIWSLQGNRGSEVEISGNAIIYGSDPHATQQLHKHHLEVLYVLPDQHFFGETLG